MCLGCSVLLQIGNQNHSDGLPTLDIQLSGMSPYADHDLLTSDSVYEQLSGLRRVPLSQDSRESGRASPALSGPLAMHITPLT
jgi:hypothetical protein